MKISKIITILVLLLLTGLFNFPVYAQDITELVKIQVGDSWIYDTPEGVFEYNVTKTFVNDEFKEVNAVTSNATITRAPILFWQDGSFSASLQIKDFTEFFATRGNYWHGCDGSAIVKLQFDTKTFNYSFTQELWHNALQMGSQNLAIITGEPQKEGLTFSYYQEFNVNYQVDFFLDIIFSIVPSVKYDTVWKETPIRAINITETVEVFMLSIDININDTSYEYHKVFQNLIGTNIYSYANEIGLPIRIERNLILSTLSGFGASINQGSSALGEEILIDYSIEDSKLQSQETLTETTSYPFAFIINMVILLFIVLKITKIRRKNL